MSGGPDILVDTSSLRALEIENAVLRQSLVGLDRALGALTAAGDGMADELTAFVEQCEEDPVLHARASVVASECAQRLAVLLSALASALPIDPDLPTKH